MITFDFDEPNTRAGHCPVCENHADIYCSRDGQWHCRICNWSGVTPVYTISRWAKERIEAWESIA